MDNIRGIGTALSDMVDCDLTIGSLSVEKDLGRIGSAGTASSPGTAVLPESFEMTCESESFRCVLFLRKNVPLRATGLLESWSSLDCAVSFFDLVSFVFLLVNVRVIKDFLRPSAAI